jgi:predicted alpha-1,2-mannosidase
VGAIRSLRRKVITSAVSAALTGLTLMGVSPAASAATTQGGNQRVTDPASVVNPLLGTGSGGKTVGDVDTFPGADYPFGMIQWSPDTFPDRTDGGGYYYGDNQIMGFSLTHISGPGCGAYGDVPILPTVGAVGSNPTATTESFSHKHEQASAGYYQVDLGSPAIASELTVTPRTGIGKFQFPPTQQANFLIKTGDSQNGDSASTAQIVGNNEVVGSATSGHFCGAGNEVYTVHFVLQFNHPFVSHGTWTGSGVTPGGNSVSDPHGGAWVTFDTTKQRTVVAKVAISFVSQANAERNLAAEDPGWSFRAVRTESHAAWNNLLNKIQIFGGTPAQQQTFYTALYHSLLHPNIFSDVNGQYMGFDNKVHTVAPGHASYANYSGWDIYRSDVPLASIVDPSTMSDVVQTMLSDYQQTGTLNKWTLAHGETYVMVGDPADPIIADAYTFGARNFQTSKALADMKAEATKPNPIRPGLNYLEQLGYLPSDGSYGCCNFYGPVSTTLEYNSADFAIGQLAAALGNQRLATKMTTRAQDWENVFNPGTGFMQPRMMNGQFVTPFDPTSQSYFVEGDAYQYNEMVPFNVGSLINARGGDAAFINQLNAYFKKLNAGPDSTHDWAGNEPNLASPWEYDYAGAPYLTQGVVRRIMTTVYGDRPGAEPGNDDLGAMSSWYVWAALGLYPEAPGAPDMVLGSPLFPKAVVHLANNRELVIKGNGASASSPYVQSLTVNGQPTQQTSISVNDLLNGPAGGTTTMDFTLGSSPNTSWGSAPSDAPPSYTTGQKSAIPFLSTYQVTVPPGGSTQLTVGAQNVTSSPIVLRAKSSPPSGISVIPSTATFSAPGAGSGRSTITISAAANTPQTFYNLPITLRAGQQNLGTQNVTVLVATPGSLLTYFDNRGITSNSDQSAGNFDGGGYSYSQQALAGAGLTPGGTVTVDGTQLTWPNSPSGYPDNVVAAGQTIPVKPVANAAQIGFLGAANNGPSAGDLTLNYTDGTSQQFQLGFSDWTLGAGHEQPSYGNQVVATLPYRNCSCGTSQSVKTYVFYAALPLDPSKTLESVTLPNGASQGALHVFSIGTSAQAPNPPVVDSLSPPTASAGQQVTINGTGFGASQGSGYVQFSDNGINWGAPGNAASLTIDSWSNTSITFTVPTPSGSNGQWHVFPGTNATVAVVPAGGSPSDAAVLQIAPSANPAAYYDNTGISPDNNQQCANYDGDGYSYSADALAKAGLTPGSTVTADGLTFTWPNVPACQADNILASGQTMLVNGKAGDTRIGFLGSSSNGSSSGTVVIHYTDGTTSTQKLSFNDWASGPGNGDTTVATMPYRNSISGNSQSITMYVFATTVAVNSHKTVASITFPDVSNSVGSSTTAMHIFAVSAG